MKAYGYEKHGDPEVFQEYEVPEPTPAANQVLIRTIAVGLNNRERAERAGGFGSMPSPYIPGRDVVGEIVKVGERVSDLSEGELVMTHTERGYAEFVLGNLDATVVVPDGITPTRAAGLITPGLTAYKKLFSIFDFDQII